jgi:molecular chaperone DnaK (HSP70)
MADMESLGSCMSELSINIDGTELNLESFIDHVFKEIQHAIGRTHTAIRFLANADERNETVEEYSNTYCEIVEYINMASELFTDLPKSLKDLLPLRDTEEKEVFKEMVKELKEKLKNTKAKRKEELLNKINRFEEQKED